jgi:decaprenylphospho-beta-D-erythro-pentofuranosid-2-ulose 2-reductase
MKRILIIGATSAIAEHCARIWAARGDALHLVARNEQHVQVIASDLKVRGASEVTTYCTDLNDMDKHEELLNVADDALGRCRHRFDSTWHTFKSKKL